MSLAISKKNCCQYLLYNRTTEIFHRLSNFLQMCHSLLPRKSKLQPQYKACDMRMSASCWNGVINHNIAIVEVK
jgi:hypothetical protein